MMPDGPGSASPAIVQQPCLSFVFLSHKQRLRFQHCGEEFYHFVEAGDQSAFVRPATVAEPEIEWFEPGIVTVTGLNSHVEHLTQFGSPTSGSAFA